MHDLVELFCSIDDFWKTFKSKWDAHLIDRKKNNRGPDPLMTIPEMMTIVVLFHQSDYRTFKYFYMYVQHKTILPFAEKLKKLVSGTTFWHLDS